MEQFFKTREPVALLIYVRDILGTNGYAITVVMSTNAGRPTSLEIHSQAKVETEWCSADIKSGKTVLHFFCDKAGMRTVLAAHTLFTITGSGDKFGLYDAYPIGAKRMHWIYSMSLDKARKLAERRQQNCHFSGWLMSTFGEERQDVWPESYSYSPDPVVHPDVKQSTSIVDPAKVPPGADPAKAESASKAVDWDALRRAAQDD